jgi:7-keto-8-aminopelargonate synthetase-like enzyme
VQTLEPGISWEAFLEQRARAGEFRFALAADSINPTPGHINDFSFLTQTDPRFEIVLLVDDSHGIGWLGNAGTGIRYLLNLPPHVELILHFSLSKAFHLNGGAVCASAKWVEKMKRHVNFATSTPFMPALAYAWLQSRDLCLQQRGLLLQNIDYLQNRFANTTFVTNEGTPVFVVHKKALEPYLLQQHVIISSFSYPHPNREPVNRVVVNALHTKSDLEKLANLIMDFE